MNYIAEWWKQILPKEKIVIIGAGSLGKLTVDCILRNRDYQINNIAILDDNEKIHGKKVLGVPIIGSISDIKYLIKKPELSFVVAIADNDTRKAIVKKYPSLNYKSVISKNANISPFSRIGAGCIILPGVVVDPDVKIMNHVIINKSSTIAHDVILHNFSQVSPGVNFGGYVELGECSFIGLGASVLPFKKISNNVVVGAGAVVTKDINKPHSIYVGNPAKMLRQKTNKH